jgi:cation-transporting ATPase E
MVVAGAVASSPTQGLSSQDVRDRFAQGLSNDVPAAPTRTVADILRANILTRFNLLLGGLLIVVLFVAPLADALFGLVLVGNTLIGIVQELRAKRALDELTLLNAPKATVRRDGTTSVIPVSGVVLDDILLVQPGDQIIVDGSVVAAEGLEIDESLLTGESEPIDKSVGDECLSGSFVVAGRGLYRARRVGKDAYAVRLAEEAKRFTLVRSELRNGIDSILLVLSWAIPPTILLLAWSQFDTTDNVREALRGAAAGAVGMVPQGLVLLTSIAFAVGVVRLAKRRTLVQELPAIEMLARVDTVLFDKTGTLTEGRLAVEELVAFGDSATVIEAVGAVANADVSPNSTMAAIAAAYPDPGWAITDRKAFSSARRWSAASFGNGNTIVLGAPDVLGPSAEVARQVSQRSSRGKRVLLVATTRAPLRGDELPGGLRTVALVVLSDRVRPDVAETLAYFERQGVAAKVISGDDPMTVAAIATKVGLKGEPMDGADLPTDVDELADAMDATAIFGRVSPHQKRAIVAAMQKRGHVLAMTGDGVNDVLALKDADIGIAMGTGSVASRSVAQLVLLDGAFESLPAVVGEGRRVIANIERVANLFVTKTVYAFLLAIVVGFVGRPFPFVPRHLTLVGSVTIGIPAFWLALAPSARKAARGFVRRVLRFAIPVGTLAAAATFAGYEVAISEDLQLVEARTVATIVLGATGLFALGLVSRPFSPGRRLLIGAMTLLLFLALATEGGRSFFELNLPGPAMTLAAVGVVAITGSVMFASLRAVGWVQHMPDLLNAEWWRRQLPRVNPPED